MLTGFEEPTPAEDGDDRALPDGEFWAFDRRFHFTIDAAASDKNARLPRYWTRAHNALRLPWADERVWCNPPFSDLRPWVEKAWEERNAQLIVMLLPANRTEQPFWQDLIEARRDQAGSPLRVEFLANRLRFYRPGQSLIGLDERPPFACCLCIWQWQKFQQPFP